MTHFRIFASCFCISALALAVVSANLHAEATNTGSESKVQTTEVTMESVEEVILERTDWYYETEQGSYIVSTPYGELETIIHPTLVDFTPVADTELVSVEEIPLAEGPVVQVSGSFDASTFQVNRSYNIPKEFYYDILPEDMHCLVDSICNLEQTQDISSMFLFAVAATEVGWHGECVGDNNWFNWTPDAEDYQTFSSVEECVEYTGKQFTKQFFNPDWYAEFGQTVDDYFTISDVNSRYAFYDDCSVNWYWGEVVAEILDSMNTKYMRWLTENYG